VVVRDLPKVVARVRFPYPAPKRTLGHAFVEDVPFEIVLSCSAIKASQFFSKRMPSLKAITFMKELVKLIVFVPKADSEKVRMAVGDAGAGKIGNYTYCSFTTSGIGRFKPETGANPAIGEVGKLEEVEEDRIEVACEKKDVNKIITAIKKVHPYEEVVIDIYPMLVIEND
jgi:hypothetical protein